MKQPSPLKQPILGWAIATVRGPRSRPGRGRPNPAGQCCRSRPARLLPGSTSTALDARRRPAPAPLSPPTSPPCRRPLSPPSRGRASGQWRLVRRVCPHCCCVLRRCRPAVQRSKQASRVADSRVLPIWKVHLRSHHLSL